MAEKKLYLGSVGPFLYEDDEAIDDADGEFSGQLRRALATNGQLYIGEEPSDDYDVARYVDLLSGWLNIVHITSDYIVLATDCIILVDCSNQDIIITLPIGIAKKPYEIVRIDDSNNELTVKPDGIETINDEIEQILFAEGDAMKIISDGSNWYII